MKMKSHKQKVRKPIETANIASIAQFWMSLSSLWWSSSILPTPFAMSSLFFRVAATRQRVRFTRETKQSWNKKWRYKRDLLHVRMLDSATGNQRRENEKIYRSGSCHLSPRSNNWYTSEWAKMQIYLFYFIVPQSHQIRQQTDNDRKKTFLGSSARNCLPATIWMGERK